MSISESSSVAVLKSCIEPIGVQWFLGKSCDTFCPMGPWIVPASEINGQDLAIQCWVNDELRQVSSSNARQIKIMACNLALFFAQARKFDNI